MDQNNNEAATKAHADKNDAVEQTAKKVEAPEAKKADAPKAKNVDARPVKTERKPADRKPAGRKPSARKTASTKAPEAAKKVKAERKPYTRKVVNAAPVLETPYVAQAAKAAASAFSPKEISMQFDPANWIKSFTSLNAAPAGQTLPGSEGLQAMINEAGSRGQNALERSRTVAEEVSGLARANMEALVETGRIAAAGAKSLGETVLERSRVGLEHAAAEVKTLTEAQSPTEFFQRQSEIARSSFDRAVADGSRFTESLVKLAGEAMRPLSSQAAVNAEKIKTIAA